MVNGRWLPSTCAALVLPALLLATPARTPDAKLAERVRDASAVYQELLKEPDRAVPETLLANARGIAVIPHVIKGALGYGARYGRGVISCRDSSGAWSPISFVTLTGGSIGFQIGGQSSDVVLFFMTDRGARSLIGSKFTLGGSASVAAGPVGRTGEASTDVKLNAEIYSYAKAKGLFAGVSLEGARLAPDEKANAQYYGAPATAQALLFEHRSPRRPAEAEAFLNVLPH